MSDIVLHVSGLNVHYGAIHALKGLNFEVGKGEIVSLIGCNGAGKSTTLRALSGIIESRGEVIFNGEKLHQMSPQARVAQGLAQAPEGRGVFPQMTVYENLILGAYLRKDKVEIYKDLDKCYQLFPRLKERAQQLAGTLSGGEQQMVAICRALMSRPKMLLLDEPSMGLAPLIVSQIFQIIRDLNSEGMTILLVEQNAKQALKISDRAYVLETGQIVMKGRGLDLLNNSEVQTAYLGL